MGETEQALDGVYDLLLRGAERLQEQRARSFALAIARDRMRAMRVLLSESGIEALEKRIEQRAPSLSVVDGEAGGALTLAARKR